MKFGGTSVASPEKLIDIVRKAVERDRTILVCSAISKCTDTLIRLGNWPRNGTRNTSPNWPPCRTATTR